MSVLAPRPGNAPRPPPVSRVIFGATEFNAVDVVSAKGISTLRANPSSLVVFEGENHEVGGGGRKGGPARASRPSEEPRGEESCARTFLPNFHFFFSFRLHSLCDEGAGRGGGRTLQAPLSTRATSFPRGRERISSHRGGRGPGNRTRQRERGRRGGGS